MKTATMTEEEYREHENEMNGLCTACGEFRFGMTEGDAEDYPCEACGENAVKGIANCLIEGLIDITDDPGEEHPEP